MQFLKIVSLASVLVSTHAHFLLNYPQTRGFDEDKEPNFCGGFTLKTRSQFPLSGGIVSITSEHPKSNIDILVSFDANPTAFAQFNKTASGNPIPFLLNFTRMNAQGDACFPVNISALGVAEAQNGANATIQVQFDGGDGRLFQCADVTLSDSFTVPSGTKCDNATAAFPSSTAPSNPGSGSSAPSNTPASSGSSAPSGSSSSGTGSPSSARATAFTAASVNGVLGALVGIIILTL